MSAREKTFGTIVSLLSILIGIVYFYALLGPGGYALLALEVVVSLMMLFGLGIIFWVGYTISTTPSIEEIERGTKKK